MPQQKHMRVSELAELLGVSKSSVRRWLSKGEGPAHTRTPGGTYLFHDPRALDDWINSLRNTAANVESPPEPKPDAA